jgi:hypothetical protein
MSILKQALFLKGTIAGHKIYIVPKGVRVNFSIVPLKVPEGLQLLGDCKDALHRKPGKEQRKKRNSHLRYEEHRAAFRE